MSQVTVEKSKPAYLKDDSSVGRRLIFAKNCFNCEAIDVNLDEEDGVYLNNYVNGEVYCDDCSNEDGSITCNDCGMVFKGFVPDRRTELGRALWKEYGTEKIVTCSIHSNISCVQCAFELGFVHKNGMEVRDD